MCCITDKPEENQSPVSRDYNNNLLRFHKTKDAGVTEFQTEGREGHRVGVDTLLDLFSSQGYKLNTIPSTRMCVSSISNFYFFVHNHPMKSTEQVYDEE